MVAIVAVDPAENEPSKDLKRSQAVPAPPKEKEKEAFVPTPRVEEPSSGPPKGGKKVGAEKLGCAGLREARETNEKMK